MTVYVNPKGDVKPCYGFAIELDAMTIGNIYNFFGTTTIRMRPTRVWTSPLSS